jgi:hypothetical protein
MQNTIEFLRRIYGGFEHDGVFTIIHINKWRLLDDGTYEKKKRAHVKVFRYHLSEIEDIDWGVHLDANADKADIYFGSSLRHPNFLESRDRSRGGVEHCSLSTCLAIDIDYAFKGAHKARHLPPDLESVASIIALGPDPSIAIDSGYGSHFYWIYDEDVELDGKKVANDYGKFRKKAHSRYVKGLKDKGWSCDSTWTIDRIWRLPGFDNWKVPTSPRPVTVIYGLEGELEDLEVHDRDTLTPSTKKTKETKETKPEKRERSSSVSSGTPKAFSVDNLPESLKIYSQRYYDDSLHPSGNQDADELHQKSQYINRLLAGESIEEKGNRDFALTKICGIICFLTQDVEEFSEKDLKYIVEDLMHDSLQAWVDDSEDDTDLDREYDKAIEKLSRIKEKDKEKQQVGLTKLAQALKRDRPQRPLDDDGEVSGDDEEEEELSKEELLQFGMVIFGAFMYLWDWKHDRYFNRFVRYDSDKRAAIRECWPEDDQTCPFKHSFVNEDGISSELATGQLERLYSRVAETSYFSYCVSQTCFEVKERALIINPAPVRYKTAKFSSEIDDWLRLLGGKEHYETLCRWYAGLNHLDKPCAALYLNGPPGCGKSLFALGAAQLWAKTVPLYETVARGFNETMLNCPVALIDEGITGETKNASMTLRRLVAQGSHSVNCKNGPILRLQSYLRFVVAANNDEVLLSGKEERLSRDDARAMSERIIYVKIDNDDARNWMIANNRGQEMTDRWINDGDMARHILWLGENIDLSKAGRFLVEGKSSDMRDKVIFQGDQRNEALEWITQFCEAPERIRGKTRKGPPAAEIGNDRVGINVKLMKQFWNEFSGDANSSIPHAHLLRHIKALATRNVKVRVNDASVRYWEIPADLILLYAETHDIGDVDRIRSFANRNTEITSAMAKSKQNDTERQETGKLLQFRAKARKQNHDEDEDEDE